MGDECGYVGRVAGPQLTADRSAFAIDHHAHDHLFEVGPVVLAVAALAQCVSAPTFEVDGRGVEKDEVQRGEEVAVAREERLFDKVFVASR